MSTLVCITIDTEEDNWGKYGSSGATVANIGELPRLQAVFDRWGARPTYLVNYPPLQDDVSLRVLSALAERVDVEIGAHCHPWNTPPTNAEGERNSMMFRHSRQANHAMIQAVRERLVAELGVTPASFRAGRWGFGTSVAEALVSLDFSIDCSVSPFIDWSPYGGPDFSNALPTPYRFSPSRPLVPDAAGTLVEMPTTIGFLRGGHVRSARMRTRLERSPLARLKIVGALDRLNLLARRWLSPEVSSADTMVRLSDAWVGSFEEPVFLQMTFHSCTLLPGATPFVRDMHERERFLKSIGTVLNHLADNGCEFVTMSEAARRLVPDDGS